MASAWICELTRIDNKLMERIGNLIPHCIIDVITDPCWIKVKQILHDGIHINSNEAIKLDEALLTTYTSRHTPCKHAWLISQNAQLVRVLWSGNGAYDVYMCRPWNSLNECTTSHHFYWRLFQITINDHWFRLHNLAPIQAIACWPSVYSLVPWTYHLTPVCWPTFQ